MSIVLLQQSLSLEVAVVKVALHLTEPTLRFQARVVRWHRVHYSWGTLRPVTYFSNLWLLERALPFDLRPARLRRGIRLVDGVDPASLSSMLESSSARS